MKLIDDSQCFACGMDNPDGLRIPWKVEGNTMTGEFTCPKKFQGWKGIVHGGIISTLLDEAMTRLAGVLFGSAVTAEMTVRFIKPAPIGEKLLIKGELVKNAKRMAEMQATIHLENGTLIARSSGKAMKIS